MKTIRYLLLALLFALWIWTLVEAPWAVSTYRTARLESHEIRHSPLWESPRPRLIMGSDWRKNLDNLHNPNAPREIFSDAPRLKIQNLVLQWAAIGFVAFCVLRFSRPRIPNTP